MDSTLIAGIIGAGGATIGVVIAKDTKVSEFRQQWVDGLRADVSQLCSLSNSLFGERKRITKDSPIAQHLRVSKDIERLNTLAYRIRLRLDLKKDDSKLLIREIDILIGRAFDCAHQADLDKSTTAVALATADLLDTAWGRVKKGETRFRVVLWSTTLVLIGSLCRLLYQHFHPDNSAVNCITLEQPLHVEQAPVSPTTIPQVKAPLQPSQYPQKQP